MWPNSQFPADLVTFTEEILNGKFQSLRGASLLVRVSWSCENFMKWFKDNIKVGNVTFSLSETVSETMLSLLFLIKYS